MPFQGDISYTSYLLRRIGYTITHAWSVRSLAIQVRGIAGNTWGQCENGVESVGCGDQETFINCADVEIYSNAPSVPANTIDNPWLLYYRLVKYCHQFATCSHVFYQFSAIKLLFCNA